MNIIIKKTCLIMLCIFISIFSITKISNIATNPDFEYNKTNIASFDDKIGTVMGLSAGSAIVSTIISAIPGDAGTPIADQLAEFSKYFLIIMSALFLEQYFVIVSGFIITYLIIPATCLFLALYILFNDKRFKDVAIKILLTGIIIYAIVPCTVKITNLVSQTYEETIVAAESNELANTNNEDAGVIEKLSNAAETTLDKAGTYLSQLIKALAVMIVITCLIPLLVLLIAFWLLKIVVTQNVYLPRIDQTTIKDFLSKKE